MVIVMEHAASEESVQKVIEALVEGGYDVHRSSGIDFTVLGAVGVPHTPIDPRRIEVLPGVREVVRVSEPYKLAGRTFKAEDTIVDVAGVLVGGTEVIVMAGPCSVESAEQVGIVAKSVAASGARILRGGAFKPRTSPYSFQGYGEEALKWMRAAADANGMAVISEVMDVRHIEMMMRYVDCLQVGARNMQNFDLLKELGRVRKPVLLKRGLSATIEEWLLSAEYVLAGGNGQVILCERGIRTFETYTRNTLDISAIPVVKKRSHLPDRGGPEPRHGPPREGHPHGPRGGGGGRRRPHHRGPQQPREGALRRPAEPLPRPVRPPDGRAADHRPRAGADGAARARVSGARQPRAGRSGTIREARSFGSRVTRGTLWTTLVAAISSSAGSLCTSRRVLSRAISAVMGQT